MISKYKQILDQNIQNFLEAIKKTVSIDNRTIHVNHPDYPILMPDSINYYEQNYYQGKLEWYIRDYLITGVITKWLKIAGIRCFNLVDKDPKLTARFSYSNSSFGKKYPLAFIIERENKRIGYRYSDINDYSYKNSDKSFFDLHSDLRIISLFKKYQLNEIAVIRWKEKRSFANNNLYPQNQTLNNRIHSVLITDFLDELFSKEVSQLYIKSVREAVSNAYKEIGYQTVSNLSLKHLSDFKDDIIQNLHDFDIKTTQYAKFSKTGDLTNELSELLPLEDYNIIENRCYKNNLIQALSGRNKFARCFMTSEHLYEMFKNDNQNYYDYSTIVSGYFKSVELLLEEAMLATLTHDEHENLQITSNNTKNLKIGDDWIKKGRFKHIRFIDTFKSRFSTDMGSLITFLEENTKDQKAILDILNDFNSLATINEPTKAQGLYRKIMNKINTVLSDVNTMTTLYSYGMTVYSTLHSMGKI